MKRLAFILLCIALLAAAMASCSSTGEGPESDSVCGKDQTVPKITDQTAPDTAASEDAEPAVSDTEPAAEEPEAQPSFTRIERDAYVIEKENDFLILTLTKEGEQQAASGMIADSIFFTDAAAYRDKVMNGTFDANELAVLSCGQKTQDGGILLPDPDALLSFVLPEGYKYLSRFTVGADKYGYAVQTPGKKNGTLSVWYGPAGTYEQAEAVFNARYFPTNGFIKSSGALGAIPCDVYDKETSTYKGRLYIADVSGQAGHSALMGSNYCLKSEDPFTPASDTAPLLIVLIGKTAEGIVYECSFGPGADVLAAELFTMLPTGGANG